MGNKHYPDLDAEDIVSKAFMLILEKIERRDPIKLLDKAKLVSYFKKVMDTMFYKHHEKNQRRKRLLSNIIVDRNTWLSFYDYLESAEQEKLLMKHLDKMKPKNKKIITGFYFEEKSIKELAKELGYSDQSMKIMLYRSRQELRKLLDQSKYKAN